MTLSVKTKGCVVAGSLCLRLATAVVFLITTCPGQASEKEERPSLRDLRQVGLVIGPVASAVEKNGLPAEQIRIDVTRKLRMAGIEILTADEAGAHEEFPTNLRVDLHIIPGGRYGFSYVYYIYVECIAAAVSKQSSPRESLEAIWSKSVLGAANGVRKIRNGIKDVMDMFVDDYLAANRSY